MFVTDPFKLFASRGVRKSGEDPYKNYIKWNDFISVLLSTSQLEFAFSYETLGGSIGYANYKVNLSQKDIEWMVKSNYQVYSCSI